MATTDSPAGAKRRAAVTSPGAVIGVILVATFMDLVDVTIVAVAAPNIQASLGASPAQLQWMIAAYALTGNRNLLLAGVAAGLVLLVAAVTQPVATRVGARPLQLVGLLALAGGTALLLIAGATRSLVVVIAAAAVAGIGQGLAFMGAIRSANHTAPSKAHAAVISTFYIATYLGVGVPVVGVGLLATSTSTTIAVDVFAVIAGLGSLAVAAVHARAGRAVVASAVGEQPTCR